MGQAQIKTKKNQWVIKESPENSQGHIPYISMQGICFLPVAYTRVQRNQLSL